MAEQGQYRTEEWGAVAEYQHEVSNNGRVRRSCAAPGVRTGHIMALHPDRMGYPRVSLRRNKERPHKFLVHLLVLRAFVGMAPKGHYANHRNGDKTDNRVENLEWVTRSQNQVHAFETGLQGRGEKHGGAKLTDAQVLEIRSRYTGAWGEQTRIAKEYGVTQNLISKIVNGDAWAHLGGPIVKAVAKNAGARHGHAKLSVRAVRRIRERADGGALHDDLAADYNTTTATISGIVRRRTWKHVI